MGRVAELQEEELEELARKINEPLEEVKAEWDEEVKTGISFHDFRIKKSRKTKK